MAGFIPLRNLSDKQVTNPADRVQVGMVLHSRITKIDIDRFQVELTSKTSDLVDEDNKWKLQKDTYYDYDTENMDKKKEEDKKNKQRRQTYMKRVIAHPSFHNIDYRTCEKLMLNMDQGDIIIRPSSKGSDRLTVTWKVAGSILQHIDVKEEGKENSFSIGKALWIGNEPFEDLDEIIARHIQPMAAFARDIINYKNYREMESSNIETIERLLTEEKRRMPSKIPYSFTPSAKYPGKFMLSYLPRRTCKHEFVTVTTEGVRYRGNMFHSLGSLMRWFKEHFRDPLPVTTPTQRTPIATPMGTVDQAAIQRAAAGLPSSVYNSLQQVAGQYTPYGNNTPYGQFQGGGMNNPMVTPVLTPGQPGSMTPSQSMGPPMKRQQQTPQYPNFPADRKSVV